MVTDKARILELAIRQAIKDNRDVRVIRAMKRDLDKLKREGDIKNVRLCRN